MVPWILKENAQTYFNELGDAGDSEDCEEAVIAGYLLNKKR